LAEVEEVIDLTAMDWTIRCSTQWQAKSVPEDPANKNKITEIFERLRDFETRHGACEDYDLEEQPVKLPKNSIPGEVHQHLKALGVLDHDPLFRFEHIDQSWVALQEWTYETAFTISSRQQLSALKVLKLDKVGTFAEVFLNDKRIATLDNLYRTYYVDLGENGLGLGLNKLRIVIASTVKKTFELRANYTQ